MTPTQPDWTRAVTHRAGRTVIGRHLTQTPAPPAAEESDGAGAGQDPQPTPRT